MRWPASAREDERVVAIVETAYLAAKQIAGQYPRHVSVEEQTEM